MPTSTVAIEYPAFFRPDYGRRTEIREDFRNFRIDRILEMSPSDVFEDQPEKWKVRARERVFHGRRFRITTTVTVDAVPSRRISV